MKRNPISFILVYMSPISLGADMSSIVCGGDIIIVTNLIELLQLLSDGTKVSEWSGM